MAPGGRELVCRALDESLNAVLVAGFELGLSR